MTPRTLADILLKIWGFTLIVGAALGVPSVFSHFAMGTSDGPSWRLAAGWNLVHLLFTLIAGIAVVKFAPDVAERLSPKAEESQGIMTFPALDVVAFGVLGAVFFVEGLRDLSSALFQLSTKPVYENETISYMWRQAPEAVIGAAVQTGAGVALFVGRFRLSTLLRTLRQTPTTDENVEDDGGGPTPRSS